MIENIRTKVYFSQNKMFLPVFNNTLVKM